MKKIFLPAIFFCLALSASAENVFFNGSFELGLDGVSAVRQIRPDTNSKLEFVPLASAPAAPGCGKNSLLVRNRTCEPVKLYFREVHLKADTDYVLEFKARCTSGKQPVRLLISQVKFNKQDSLDWNGCTQNFTLTGDWKTYQKKFNTRQSRLDGYSFVEIDLMIQDKATPSDFYFDDIKLCEVSKKPVDSVNIAITTDDYLTVADRAAKVPVGVKIGNFSAQAYAENVTVTARNDWDGKSFSRELKVKLSPGEIKNYPVEFTLNYGCWTLTAAAPGVRPTAVLDGSIAVIGKYVPKKLDLNKDFCISFNGGLHYNGYPSYKQYGYVVNNVPIEKQFEYLSRMGCRMLREHDAGYETTCWVVFEPEENKFDFRHFDYSLNLYEKYNIECFPCLGRINFLRAQPKNVRWWTKKWPEWVDKQCHEVEYASYNWSGGPKGYCFLPPMELWRKYVRMVVNRAKGRIRFYEIFNEPNGVMSSASYTPMLKAAYEEIKKADPEAKVIGLCVTEDFGARTSGFIKECLDRKAGDYMDIVSFHPYSSRELGSPNPADQLLAEFRDTLKKKSGKDFPLWNTEIYYIFDTPSKNGSVQQLCRPNHIALRLLTDLGEGVKQSASLNSNQIWKRRLIPHHAFRTNVELIPDENFVVNNAIARFFEAAVPVAKHRFSGVIAYSFRKDGKPVAAIWNYERKKGVKADLSKFTVYDLFGTPLKAGMMPVTDAPYYLRPGKNMSDEAFFNAVKNIQFELERPVLVSNQVRRAGNFLFATLINQTDKAVSGTAGFRDEKYSAARTVSFTLAAKESKNIVLPLKLSSSQKKDAVFTLYINSQFMTFPVSVFEGEYIKGGKKVDMKGSGNFSGNWKLTARNGKLIFKLHVNDPTDSGKENPNHPWEQDCVELFLDFDPLSLPLNHAETYTPEVIRLFLLPRLEESKQLQIWGDKKIEITRKIRKTPNGYDVELSMPCKTDTIGFALKLNDAEAGAKTHETLNFTAGSKTHLNRLHFNIVNLK